ncbi:MAG: hypothetical protein Q8K59_10600 [Nitrosomonas sp.]|nr:hypothetical protein [Nitrosomonas sp.]MDP1951521.1 hypothetical protein [Nitrosomonas sp.]
MTLTAPSRFITLKRLGVSLSVMAAVVALRTLLKIQSSKQDQARIKNIDAVYD